MVMTHCVCISPLFAGGVFGADKKTGDIKEDAEPFDNFILVPAAGDSVQSVPS